VIVVSWAAVEECVLKSPFSVWEMSSVEYYNLFLKRFLIWMSMASIGMCIASVCIMIACLPSRFESFDPRATSIFVDAAEILESNSDPNTLV
jgi:hypothetical protein